MSSAAFASSPSEVSSTLLEVEQLQAIQIDDSGSHRFDLQLRTNDAAARLLLGLRQSALQRLGARAQFGDRIGVRSGRRVVF